MRDDRDEVEKLESLCSRAADGDRGAFAELVERTHRTVWRVALRVVRTEADAEDAVQEAYARAWKELAGLRDRKAVLAWICRVARNVATDRLRERARRPAVSLDAAVGEGMDALVDLVASEDPGVDEQIADAETGAAVRAALAGLKEKHRTVLALREIDGMSYEAIGEALGCSVGTVESRLHRARRALARRLRRLAREMGKEMPQ
jgi:RNA polymerase sigma-70 factor (ECF subfamily)